MQAKMCEATMIISGEVGRMYEDNVDDVGYRLVAVYTPVREDGVEGEPVSALTEPISVVGVEAEDNMIELLLSGVEGKDLTELLAHGREKLAAVPSSGGGAIDVAGVAGGSTAAPATAAVEPKKEEKVEEKKESDDMHGLQLVCLSDAWSFQRIYLKSF